MTRVQERRGADDGRRGGAGMGEPAGMEGLHKDQDVWGVEFSAYTPRRPVPPIDLAEIAGQIVSSVRVDMEMGLRSSGKEYYVEHSLGSKKRGVEIHPAGRR